MQCNAMQCSGGEGFSASLQSASANRHPRTAPTRTESGIGGLSVGCPRSLAVRKGHDGTILQNAARKSRIHSLSFCTKKDLHTFSPIPHSLLTFFSTFTRAFLCCCRACLLALALPAQEKCFDAKTRTQKFLASSITSSSPKPQRACPRPSAPLALALCLSAHGSLR